MNRLLIFVLLSFLTVELVAQQLYDHTPDSRIAAMGGASVATRGDAFATFGNAASVLMEYKSVQAAFSYVNFSGELYRKNRMLSAGAYARFAQRHALLVGMQFNMEPRVADNSPRPGSQRFDLSYGYKFSDKVALAATARFRRTYSHLLESDNYNGGGGDVALFCRLPLNFRPGVALNVGGKLSFDVPQSPQYDRYTFAVATGASLSMPFSDAHLLDVSAEVRYGASCREDIFAAKLGVEYSLMRLFYFRAGGNIAHLINLRTLPYGSIGAGVRFFHLQFDIAYIMGKKDTPFNNAVQVNFGLDF